MDYDRLVQRHRDSVYRQLVRACGNRDDAEDILVEALLNAYRALPQLQDEGAFQAWLATIGRRLCTRVKHRAAMRPVLSLSAYADGEIDVADPHADTEHEAEVDRLRECVQKAVKKLPAHFRDVYILREIEGKPGSAVARELGLSIPNVKSRLHRARKLVRDELDRNMCWAGLNPSGTTSAPSLRVKS